MSLYLHRLYFPKYTMGTLTATNAKNIPIFQCFTLELPWQDNQVGLSCIPEGEYDLSFEFSSRFKKNLWEIKGVPGRSETKFHIANHTKQLQGCIAPGLRFSDLNNDNIIDITDSRTALVGLHQALSGLKKSKLVIKSL